MCMWSMALLSRPYTAKLLGSLCMMTQASSVDSWQYFAADGLLRLRQGPAAVQHGQGQHCGVGAAAD